MDRLGIVFLGPALAPALLLALLVACAPVPPPPPAPGTAAHAAQALRRGDARALHAALGHDKGLLTFALGQADGLDPESWLVVMGASWREHDLAACAAALGKADEPALLDALGFRQQQVRADILDAGRTVYSRRAASMDYFETGEAPIAAMAEELLPPLPDTVLAYELTFWGTRKGRTLRLRTGRNERGLSNMQATHGLAATGFTAPPGVPRAPLPAAPEMRLPALSDPQWWGIEARIVAHDGAMRYLKLGRDGNGWFVVESALSGLQERLEASRDRRLQTVRRLATDYQRASGRWPRYLTDMTLRPRDLVDPAAPQGRLGWAELHPRPEATLRLLQPQGDAEPAVECVHAGPLGRRVITLAGALEWR